MIKIVINGQSISGEYTKTASDSVDYLRVYFSFSEEWQALVKTAQFTQGEKTYNALVEDGYCVVPTEISVGKVKLSVFGQMPGETLRITTLPFEFTVQKSGFTADGETPIPPTPDLYSQLVSKVQEAVDSVPEKLSEFENDAGYITGSEIPKKLSELENDAGYMTEVAIPEKLSEFENDAGYITESEIPKKLSELENDAGYMTEVTIPEKLSEFENDAGYITGSEIPKKLSELENDAGYMTEVTIPEKLSEFENDAGYITESEIPKKLSEFENDIGLGAGATGKDGKSAYEYAKEGGYAGTEEEFASKLANEYELNPLHGKKVSFLGDSICAGSSDNGTLGGYGKIIADRNNMSYQNLGKGGATITAETYSSSTGYAKGWLCRMIENMDADADYAIIEGGINDAWQWSDHGNIEIGEITEGYNAELDETTYYGAFESMLKQLVTKFKGKKIGYIAVPKIMSLYDSERNAPNFYHIALECCAKWGVPVCDLNNIVPPTEYLKTLGSEYTTDGTHPTYEGYLKFYCDPIEVWMRTLTTGGSNSAKMVRKAVEEYTKGFNDAIEALRKGKLDNTGISFRKAKLPLADGTTIEIDVLTAVDGTVIVPFVNRVPLSVDTDGNVFGTDYNGDGINDGYLKDTRLSSSGAVKEQAGCTATGFIPVKGGDVIRVYGCDWATSLSANNYICAYDKDFVFIGGYATTIGDAFSLTKYGTAICSEYSADDNRNLTITLSSLSDIAYIRVSSKGHSSNNYPSFNSEDMIITVNEEIS